MVQLDAEQRAMVVKKRFNGLTCAEVHRFMQREFPELKHVSFPTIKRWYDRAETQFMKTGTIGRATDGVVSAVNREMRQTSQEFGI